MKAVVLDGYTLNPGDLSWQELEELVDLTVYDRTKPEEVLERIGTAEIVLTNKTVITEEIINKAPNIKYIGVLATGYNVVDIEACRKKHIPVTNVPRYSTNAVAQLTFALLLEICHNVGHHSNEVKKGRWISSKDFCFWDYPLIELTDKTIGIIGYGSIGKRVAEIANAFGMKVLVYNRTIKNDVIGRQVSLDELLSSSDIITLHVPLTNETKDLINKETITKMKDGVIIINTARGPIINEQDLCEALNCGKVYAAGVDVACVEPINADSPLLKAKNIFITPHIGWAPCEARQRLMRIVVENIRSFLNNNPINVVNGVVLDESLNRH